MIDPDRPPDQEPETEEGVRADGEPDVARVPMVAAGGPGTGLPVPRTIQATEKPAEIRPFAGRERDFLLLTIFVLMQHRRHEKAAALAEAMIRSGDDSRESLLAHAVIAFTRGDYEAALSSLARLDRLDPIERYGQRQLTERERMRSYLRARSLYELGDGERNAIDLYLRHRKGQGTSET